MNQKSLFYGRLGIRELWAIDAMKRATHVFLEPSADGYKVLRNSSSSDLVTPSLRHRLSLCASKTSNRASSHPVRSRLKNRCYNTSLF
jgi:hypothetical protein